jgi:hypothetical protein
LSQVFAHHQDLAVDCERITQEALARLAELSADQVARDLRSRQLQQSEERCDTASRALRDKVPHAWRNVQELIAEQQLANQNAWPPMTLTETKSNSPAFALATPVKQAKSSGPAFAAQDMRPMLNDLAVNHGSLSTISRSANATSSEIVSLSPNDAVLRSSLTTTILQCRQCRSPLSLVLIAIPGEPEHPRDQASELLRSRLRKGDLPGQSMLELRPREFAVLLPDCERRAATEWASEILRQMQHIAPERGLSIGVASIAHLPRNFAADNLITAVRRCLDGAILSGSNTVKSIEVS